MATNIKANVFSEVARDDWKTLTDISERDAASIIRVMRLSWCQASEKPTSKFYISVNVFTKYNKEFCAHSLA
jgi:hypothetical protein